MVTKILIGLVVVVAVFAGVVALQPSNFRIARKEDAMEWVKRIPFEAGEVEIRQVYEADDFGPALTPELREAEERLRAQAAGKRQS